MVVPSPTGLSTIGGWGSGLVLSISRIRARLTGKNLYFGTVVELKPAFAVLDKILAHIIVPPS
jgi:hypothetical protein